jgi:hypothetical protein
MQRVIDDVEENDEMGESGDDGDDSGQNGDGVEYDTTEIIIMLAQKGTLTEDIREYFFREKEICVTHEEILKIIHENRIHDHPEFRGQTSSPEEDPLTARFRRLVQNGFCVSDIARITAESESVVMSCLTAAGMGGHDEDDDGHYRFYIELSCVNGAARTLMCDEDNCIAGRWYQ